MLDRLVASALIATISVSCTPAALSQQASPMMTLTVPAGTMVPLTLVTPIKSKSTKPGDTVRAAVAFPVTVGDQVAIPPGTYVEGVLGQPLPKVKHQPVPGVQIHFTRLVFANGYSVPLDATQASLLMDPPPLPPSESPAPAPATSLMVDLNSAERFSPMDAMTAPMPRSAGSGSRIALMAQTVPTLPTLPPLPHEGPNVGLIVGLSVAGPAAFIILGLILHHRGGSSDYIVHDAGWQFQMKLAAPLSLSAKQIALASQTTPVP
jgi:hypothetical protein